MEFEYNQIGAAKAQLETAITLYLDKNDYFSSATLAGAAEEIFGKLLESNGLSNSLSNEADLLMSLLTRAERD